MLPSLTRVPHSSGPPSSTERKDAEDTLRCDKPLARIEVTAEYESTYRSLTGPVWYNVSIKSTPFVDPEDDPEEPFKHTNWKYALKEALEELKDVYVNASSSGFYSGGPVEFTGYSGILDTSNGTVEDQSLTTHVLKEAPLGEQGRQLIQGIIDNVNTTPRMPSAPPPPPCVNYSRLFDD